MSVITYPSSTITEIASITHTSANVVNVKTVYGAKGDGVTDDAPAIQNAVNALNTIGSGTLYFPPGTYILNSSLNLLQVKGLNFIGSGPDNTTLVSNGAFPAVQCNGIWRCLFQGLRFKSAVSNPGAGVFELDGNYDGVHTMGVQGCTFLQCYFDASLLSDYGFCMTRRGNNQGQGSEDIFINCIFDSGIKAGYYQDGFNALNNTFIGGRFLNCPASSIHLSLGSINVYSVDFNSNAGYQQVLNNGWDIDAQYGGAQDEVVVEGCTTNSLRFMIGNAAQKAHIRSVYAKQPYIIWSSGQAVPLNSVVKGNVSPGNDLLYVATTAGTTGVSQPVWPATGTVADGSVTWTQVTILFANLPYGSIEDINSLYPLPGNSISQYYSQYAIAHVSTSYTASINDEIIVVDATGGNRTVTIPASLPDGKRYTIKKADTTANTVTASCGGNGIEGSPSVVIPGGSAGYLNLIYNKNSNTFLKN